MIYSTPSREQHDAGLIPHTEATGRFRWLTSCGGATLVGLLVLLITCGERDPIGSPTAFTLWLFVALLALIAWTWPTRIALVIGVLSLFPWTYWEWLSPNRWDFLQCQIVRLIVTGGLVAMQGRLRDSLETAIKLARIDQLTGLPNRQALIEAMDAELSRSRRFGRPFSIALLDCDGFKGINDRFGHLAGDEVLRRIGECLRKNMRRFDCAGRWGGDEFLLVLSEVNRDDAEFIAERLRAAIRHDVERDYPTLAFSLGIVTFLTASETWQDCIEKADATMYSAKRAGRDDTRFEVVE